MKQYVNATRKNPLKPDENPNFHTLAHNLRIVDVEKICKTMKHTPYKTDPVKEEVIVREKKIA